MAEGVQEQNEGRGKGGEKTSERRPKQSETSWIGYVEGRLS